MQKCLITIIDFGSEFILTNSGNSKVLINRLFLELTKYVRCPHCPCRASSVAQGILKTVYTEYELPLTGRYHQYDIVPLTHDGAQNKFTLEPGESEIFSIDLQFPGGIAFFIKVCIEYLDTSNQERHYLETKDSICFKIAGGGNICAGNELFDEWKNSSGIVPPKIKYCSRISNQIIYKIVINKMDRLAEFLVKLDSRILMNLEQLFIEMLNDDDSMVKKKVIATLGFLSHRNYIPRLIPLLKDLECREITADVLGSIGDVQSTSALLDSLPDLGYSFNKKVLVALGKVADPSVIHNIQDYIDRFDELDRYFLEKVALSTIEVLRQKRQEGDTKMISVLFLSADPKNTSRLRLDEEFREINEQLRLAKQRDSFKLELPQLSLRPKDISGALLNTQPQIVHFSGHGTSEGALCFEDETGQVHFVQPDALAALFEQFAGQVSCVLLNACYSEIQAKAIAEHIDYVIGMNKAIGDKAAIAFTIGFYQALGAGRPIEDAYKFGCVQIRLVVIIPEHLTPVLIKKRAMRP